MSSRPHAHLMLPSPMGLLEYDVLEDGVFLGPGSKGGLQAAPTPFKGASVALTRTAEGFVARALPGETEPLVNGETVGEKPLADGDRLRVAEQIVLFRTERGPLQPSTAPATGAASRTPTPRVQTPARRDPAPAIIALIGLALLLAATYGAVRHLKAIKDGKMTTAELPEVRKDEAPGMSRASRELEAIRDLERRGVPRLADLVARYRVFQNRHEGSPEAASAHERVRELTATLSVQSRETLDKEVEKLVGAHQFARALEAVRVFEKRFGTTPAGKDLRVLREKIRTRARSQLDALIAKVGPLITPQPREAHRMLISVSHEFPADMAVEVVGLLERAVARMMALSADRRKPRRPRAEPPSELPPFPKDPEPTPPKDGGDTPSPEPPSNAETLRERMARDAWKVAHADLLQGKYAEALQSYTMLMQQFGNSATYRTHKRKIAAGRYAAKVGVRGPPGLLAADAEMKKGRLEVEYEFNDQRVFEEDWTQEQPFSSDLPVEVNWRGGAFEMAQASGVLHKLVFLSDVRLEASVRVQQPHDFGLLAVQESNDFRAILFNVANTKFKLKKGAAARVNKGHLLWYIGQGVWADADPDAHGFIKIRERSGVKLEGGDRLKMELIRKKNEVEGSFQGKTDGVHLKGTVRGDDGSTMGSGRVGFFTNSGIITVESARLSGVVDMEWFRKQLAFLVAADPGPADGEDDG